MHNNYNTLYRQDKLVKYLITHLTPVRTNIFLILINPTVFTLHIISIICTQIYYIDTPIFQNEL